MTGEIVHHSPPPPLSSLIFISFNNNINDFSYLYTSLIEIAVAASFYLEKVSFFSHTPHSPMDPLIWIQAMWGGCARYTFAYMVYFNYLRKFMYMYICLVKLHMNTFQQRTRSICQHSSKKREINGMLWTRGGTFNTCAAAERMTLNLTGDVTVYNSTREEKHDRGGQPKHVTIFMADGWLKFWVKLVFSFFWKW